MKRAWSSSPALLVVAFLVGLVRVNSVFAQREAEEVAKHFTRSTASIPMRDGVTLHTIVYEPKEQKGKLPFILLRTPYGIDARGPQSLKEYLKDLADEGYIFVFQDIR